ncbi:hypothetical protein GCM10010330_77080 [Streptomyces tendae]|uniref:hypothetical protein n=1 Tax=Streptomyces tendae TaxID=1932 RepID=UPI0019933D05|nr:hypothetical protein [Streptomyces tendae]GHB11605.1 hypothetical protein GCM10010330_77080 [Streptomyces tendae]
MRTAALDLADLHSVESFNRSRHGPLDSLVAHAHANAGAMALPTRSRSADGWEMQLAANFLGRFALAEAPLPALRAAGSARLVVSSAHRTEPFGFEEPPLHPAPLRPLDGRRSVQDRWRAPGDGCRTALGN